MRPIGEHAAIQTPSVHTAIQAPNMHAAAAQAHAAAPRWAARNSNVSSMYAAAAQAHAAPAHADALAIETELAGPLVGHRLTHAEFLEGWLSLFDGQTNYGWQGAESKYGSLLGGRVTGRSGPCELHAWCAQEGCLAHGNQRHRLTRGMNPLASEATGTFALTERLRLSGLAIKPRGLAALFNGRDLGGWQRIDCTGQPEAAAHTGKWSIAPSAPWAGQEPWQKPALLIWFWWCPVFPVCVNSRS